MIHGRTTWYAEDAAWHRRELIVELGEEFGPGGVTVMKVLRAWAQEQRSNGGGQIRNGFRSLAREAFVTVPDAKSVVEHAADIGALDDLEIDPDGRRFTCRVSGWTADQERGRAAFRKEKQRSQSQTDDPNRDKSRLVTPSTQPNQTIEVPPSIPPLRGGRQRDKDARRDWVKSLASRWPETADRAEGLIWQAVQAGAQTVDEVQSYVTERVAA